MSSLRSTAAEAERWCRPASRGRPPTQQVPARQVTPAAQVLPLWPAVDTGPRAASPTLSALVGTDAGRTASAPTLPPLRGNKFRAPRPANALSLAAGPSSDLVSAAHPPGRRGPLPVVLSYPPALERQRAVPGTKEVAHADPPHRRAALSEQQRGCETEQLRVHQTEERAWEPAQTGARTEEQPANLALADTTGYLGRAEWRPTDAQPGLTLAGMVTRTVSSLQQVLGVRALSIEAPALGLGKAAGTTRNSRGSSCRAGRALRSLRQVRRRPWRFDKRPLRRDRPANE